MSDPNRDALIAVAERLGELLPKAAFVGGSITGVLVSGIDIRATKDVDLVVPGSSAVDYEQSVARPLRALGWSEDSSEDAPRCRWVHRDACIADVMPPVDAGFGFSNRWYEGALATATPVELKPDLTIRVVTLPYFLATKTEAFLGRGDGDFEASHELEDIVTVVAASSEAAEQVAQAADDLREFLSETLGVWTRMNSTIGHMHAESRVGPPGRLAQTILGHLPDVDGRRELAAVTRERFQAMLLPQHA